MSHFTVLVVTNSGTRGEIEEKLQPYHEYECTGVKDKYVVFVDAEESREELMKEWEEENKEDYSTFEQFVEEYYGYEFIDGKIGRMTNPNAKWDWWQIGGRCSGMLMLKDEYFEALRHLSELEARNKPIPDSLRENVNGIAVGKKSWINANKEIEQFMVDSARKDQIDFVGMQAREEKSAREEYKTFKEIVAGRELLSFEQCKEFYNVDQWLAQTEENALENIEGTIAASIGEEGDCKNLATVDVRSPIDKARDKYNGQEVVKDLKKYGPFFHESLFIEGEEQYVNHCRNSAVSTFAVLYDGQWIQKGDMGWWACVSNEDENWGENYSDLLDKIPEDKFLTVVDCHI